MKVETEGAGDTPSPQGHDVSCEQGQGGGRALQVTSGLGFCQGDGPLKPLPEE